MVCGRAVADVLEVAAALGNERLRAHGTILDARLRTMVDPRGWFKQPAHPGDF